MSFNSPFPLEPIDELIEKTETRDPRRGPKTSFQYVDIASVCNKHFQVTSPKTIETPDAPSRARKVIRESDVVFATTRPYLKSIAMVPGDLNDQICSTGFCVLRAGKRLLPEWLFYCVTSEEVIRQVVPLMRGANYPAVTDKDVKAARIPVPSLDEQRRMVGRIKDCLGRVEEISRLRSEAVMEADALLPSVLNNEFLQLAKSYGSAEIGQLALETRYGTSSKCTTIPNGTAILRIPNVAGGFVNFDDLKYCHLADYELSKLKLKQGDLLFVRTNGSRELVGRCAIFDTESDTFAFASYLIRVRLAVDRMRPKFLAFFLNSTIGRTELDKRRRTSAGQFNINSENLRSIEVPVPPVDVQDALINKLGSQQKSVIDLRAGLSDMAAEGSHLRDSILRKAFAGEL